MANGSTQGRVDWERVTIYDGTTSKDISLHFRRYLSVQCIGTGTVNWEATIDGSTWSPVQLERLSSGVKSQSATAEAIYRLDAHGLSSFRAGSATGFTKIVATATS